MTTYARPDRCTDVANAERLIRRHGHDLRHVDSLGWLVWDGRRWARDDTGRAMRMAIDTATSIFAEAASADDADARKSLSTWAAKSESAARVQAMLTLAAAHEDVAIGIAELDRAAMLFTVQNGTIDLRTGTLRPHARQDLITRLAPVEYDPAAVCPRWEKFLRRVLDEDDSLISYMQRVIGYALTADVREQCLFFFHGGGANGKSTLIELVRGMLGDYGLHVQTETLLASDQQGIPNDVARMRGARWVDAIETEQGRRLAEALVKSLTGGDTLSARFLYREFFQFNPTFKIAIAANHRPTIRGTDYAIWRRIRLVPFRVTIPIEDRDPQLPDALRAELPGILGWAVRGCIEWQRSGLADPPIVLAATAEYREEQDTLGPWIGARTVLDAKASAPAKHLFDDYVGWCADSGEEPLSLTAWGRDLNSRGFQRRKSGAKNVVTRSGIRLRTVADSSDTSAGTFLISRTCGKLPENYPQLSELSASDDDEAEYEQLRAEGRL